MVLKKSETWDFIGTEYDAANNGHGLGTCSSDWQGASWLRSKKIDVSPPSTGIQEAAVTMMLFSLQVIRM